MITPGSNCSVKATPEEIGVATVTTLLRTIPGAMPGIMFLSGGQSEDEATANLDAMNRNNITKPWNLSFSFGRALQHSCLMAWNGKNENIAEAQKVLIKKASSNSLATKGQYTGQSGDSGKQSLHVENYTY